MWTQCWKKHWHTDLKFTSVLDQKDSTNGDHPNPSMADTPRSNCTPANTAQSTYSLISVAMDEPTSSSANILIPTGIFYHWKQTQDSANTEATPKTNGSNPALTAVLQILSDLLNRKYSRRSETTPSSSTSRHSRCLLNAIWDDHVLFSSHIPGTGLLKGPSTGGRRSTTG